MKPFDFGESEDVRINKGHTQSLSQTFFDFFFFASRISKIKNSLSLRNIRNPQQQNPLSRFPPHHLPRSNCLQTKKILLQKKKKKSKIKKKINKILLNPRRRLSCPRPFLLEIQSNQMYRRRFQTPTTFINQKSRLFLSPIIHHHCPSLISPKWRIFSITSIQRRPV